MRENQKNKDKIQDKLATIKYNCSHKSHLGLEQKKCKKCKEKTCTYICPALVYSENPNNGEIVIQYENCLECGACKIACTKQAISWEYPCSGCGVVYKNS